MVLVVFAACAAGGFLINAASRGTRACARRPAIARGRVGEDTVRVVDADHPIVGVGDRRPAGAPAAGSRTATRAHSQLRVPHHAAHRRSRARGHRGGWAVPLPARGRRPGDRPRGAASTSRSGSDWGAVFPRAVRARPVLLRLPRGPDHVGRAGAWPAGRGDLRGAARRGPRRGRERHAQPPGAAWGARWAVLLALVRDQPPRAGLEPMAVPRGQGVDPQGLLGTARARRRRGVGRGHRPGRQRSSPRCCWPPSAGVAVWKRDRWPAWLGTGLVLVVGLMLLAPSTLLQMGLRDLHRAVVPHQRLDLPDRAGRGPAAGCRQPLRGTTTARRASSASTPATARCPSACATGEVALEHYAYFPGHGDQLPRCGVCFPEPLDDYRLFVLLTTLLTFSGR